MWIATEFRAPTRRLLGVVYFYFKSNSSGLINDFDEGSDIVLGDGEREEKRERSTRFVWSWAGGERAEFQPWLGIEGWVGAVGGDSCVLCSGPRC